MLTTVVGACATGDPEMPHALIIAAEPGPRPEPDNLASRYKAALAEIREKLDL